MKLVSTYRLTASRELPLSFYLKPSGSLTFYLTFYGYFNLNISFFSQNLIHYVTGNNKQLTNACVIAYLNSINRRLARINS